MDFSSNRELDTFVRQVLIDVLAGNDKALVANLFDVSGKIILDGASLTQLIKIGLGETNVLIDTEDSGIKCNCCTKCKCKVRIFSAIKSIKVDGKPLSEVSPEFCSYITDVLKISLTRIYAKTFIDFEAVPIKREESAKKNEVDAFADPIISDIE